MSVLSDKEIKRLSLDEEKKMIEPFSLGTDGISSGVSSYGYDARLGNKLYLFEKNSELANDDLVIDPKKFDPRAYKEFVCDDYFVIPPYGFALGKTFEYFRIPRDVIVICLGKSTYARCGLIVNVTPLEPGWEGYVTLEFSNTTPFPVKIYVNEGICQFIFFQSNYACDIAYNEKSGKYMNQMDIVLPKHKKEL